LAVSPSSARFRVRRKRRPFPVNTILVLKPGADRAATVNSARWLVGDVFMEYRHALNGFAVRLPEAALPAIQRNPQVLFVSPNEDVVATSSCDPLTMQCLPTGVDRVDRDRRSTRSGNGRGSVNINVGIIDSGIAVSHPDLNVVGGINCSSDKSFADGNGRGTHSAGIVGAKDNRLTIVGVVPGARLWSVRVLNNAAHGTTATVLCGIDWVTSKRTDADPSNDISVVSESVSVAGADDGNCGRSATPWPRASRVCGCGCWCLSFECGRGAAGERVVERRRRLLRLRRRSRVSVPLDSDVLA
jgi:subtilisin family serine protease